MPYRDDRDALLARLEAVLEENRRLRAENDELRRQLTAPPPPRPARVTCPKCFTESPPNFKFCLDCGETLR